jgi:hypothetical protein
MRHAMTAKMKQINRFACFGGFQNIAEGIDQLLNALSATDLIINRLSVGFYCLLHVYPQTIQRNVMV